MNKGKRYEDLACEYLKSLGYKILERNYHCRFSEIDVVALDGDTLVIVEVKGSAGDNFGSPEERFTKRKLERLVKCAYTYLERLGKDTDFRVDLITVHKKEIKHFKNVSFDI